MLLKDKTAIVTGAGSGIGRAVALELASEGAAVAVLDLNETGATETARLIEQAGGKALAVRCDITNSAQVDAAADQVIKHFGRLDICVTSAAVSRPEMLHKTTAESFRAVMEINVTGTALVAAAASAVMRAAGHGRIVMVASTAGLHGETTVSAYAASKGAVIALARTAAVEGEPKGVLTNVLLPYATTQMTEAGMDPRHAERMRSELVAPVVGALVDPSSTINGQVVVAAGSGLRAADAVEHGTVTFPSTGRLAPTELEALLERSRQGEPHTYTHAHAAFQSLAADLA